MLQETVTVNGIPIPVTAVDTAVIGSGCAGWNAADWLYDLGRRDLYTGYRRGIHGDKPQHRKR